MHGAPTTPTAEDPQGGADPAPAGGPGSGRPVRLATVLAILVLGGLFATFLSEAWLGESPFGSDADEYRMVADELRSTGRPVVAGVEGTKYPVGYPIILLVLGAITGSMTEIGLLLNVALVAVTAGATWWALRTYGLFAATIAAAYLLINPTVWRGISITMPDLLLIALLATGLVVFRGAELDRRTVALAAVVGGASVLIKSIGLLIALAASAALWWAAGEVRRLAWVPAAAGFAVYVAQSLWIGRYPTHTTGYAATFFLRDVNDFSKGTIGLRGVLGRIPDQFGVMFKDVADAVAAPQLSDSWALALAIVLLGAAVLARGHLRIYAVAFGLLHIAALVVWPYQSDRLEMPMVIVAAVGVGMLGARVAGLRPMWLRVGLLALVVVGAAWLTADDRNRVRYVAGLDQDTYASMNLAAESFGGWVENYVEPDEAIASMEYREIAYRVDRPVVALGYTRDTDELLAEIANGDARWFVRFVGLYGRRAPITEGLLDAHPDVFELAFADETVEVYWVNEVDGAR